MPPTCDSGVQLYSKPLDVRAQPFVPRNLNRSNKQATYSPTTVKTPETSKSAYEHPLTKLSSILERSSFALISTTITCFLCDLQSQTEKERLETAPEKKKICRSCEDFMRRENIAPRHSVQLEPKELESVFRQIINVLVEGMLFTEAELIQSVALFFRICRDHWSCSGFSFFLDNLTVLFAGCCLVAHKMESERGVSLKLWSRCFVLRRHQLRMIEREVLRLLDWKTFVEGKDYFATLEMLFSTSLS
ncbi:hypothetical protein BLNAU_6870 [Blattamonas nauphoetae]|uniref:Cyclin-like domain-containing protein n=1 Tax=Blattamonas nauphoetae TaxID=2049346 RepID=A0ABQ9Y345_9EUKA|nr:hypothetical protein BLNAU_6870 [Blattamonas nauphoetae]